MDVSYESYEYLINPLFRLLLIYDPQMSHNEVLLKVLNELLVKTVKTVIELAGAVVVVVVVFVVVVVVAVKQGKYNGVEYVEYVGATDSIDHGDSTQQTSAIGKDWELFCNCKNFVVTCKIKREAKSFLRVSAIQFLLSIA